MALLFESDDRNLSTSKLLVRGIIFAVVAGVLIAAGIARSQGAFEPTVRVTAIMSDLGDGLPAKSDVKYRGVLVGMVTEVVGATEGEPNRVRIDLQPENAAGIPDTVTARVVPSNVFAVPSVQLIDNGPGPALASGARISEDRSRATVQLQTSLTALSRIVEAAGRSPTDPTVGILDTVARATSGRGDAAVRAGGELERIVRALNTLAEPNVGGATLDALAASLRGLRSSAPELLDAVNHAVVPMRTVAEQRVEVGNVLRGATGTSEVLGTALERHTGTITETTAHVAPVLDVLARGSQNFVQMTSSIRNTTGLFMEEFWKPETQSGTGKIILELTPHKQYTRADCPRYGELAGPSCQTGPPGDTPVIGAPTPSGDVPGITESEQGRIAAMSGKPPDALSSLLLGPLVDQPPEATSNSPEATSNREGPG